VTDLAWRRSTRSRHNRQVRPARLSWQECAAAIWN